MTTRESNAWRQERQREHEHHEHLDAIAPPPDLSVHPFPAFTVLHYGAIRLHLGGRTLRLVLWLAHHQDRVNVLGRNDGQLHLTWKGHRLEDIEGDIHFTL